MTVAVRPQDFAGGDAAPGGTGWQIGDVVYATNPRKLVTAADRAFLYTWSACRVGFGGGRILPDPGGWLDQGYVLTRLLQIADATAEALRPKGGQAGDLGH